MWAAALLAAAVAAAVYWLGPPGVDEPAHVYQTWSYQQHGFSWWDNLWYSGRYQFVTYSVLFYPLAARIGIGASAVAAAAVLGAAGAATMIERYGSRAAFGPALLLAAAAAYTTMVGGTYPYLCGAAAAAVALWCAERGLRLGFAVAALIALGFSPLALAMLGVIVVGIALAGGAGRTVREHPVETAALVIAAGLGAAVQRLFSIGASYPYDVTDIALVTGFCVAGWLVVDRRPQALGLRGVYAVYLVANVAAFVISAPIGSNAERLFLTAGAPLLWLSANSVGRRGRLVAALIAVAVALQVGPYVRDMAWSWTNPATSRSFWAPALAFLRTHPDSEYRVEVVSSWGHWEAYYLPQAGYPIARGWFRQDDFPQNAVLYQSTLTPAEYARWLREVGVRYVILPDGPLDYSAGAEARLLRSGRSGLVDLGRSGRLRFFELPRATPIVTGPGSPRLDSLAVGRVVFTATRPGRYLVRVRYTRYWRGAPVSPGADGMTVVDVHAPGAVQLHVSPW